MEKRKKEVLKGPAEMENENGEPMFELTNAATVMECTGLIQVPPENEDELENYENVYHFSQPSSKSSKKKNTETS